MQRAVKPAGIFPLALTRWDQVLLLLSKAAGSPLASLEQNCWVRGLKVHHHHQIEQYQWFEHQGIGSLRGNEELPCLTFCLNPAHLLQLVFI